VNFVTPYARSKLSSLLGTYSESLMGGSDTTKYYVNEYPDNDIYIGIHNKAYAGNVNLDRVAKNNTSLGSSWPDSAKTTYVKLTNNGQITTYPYKLDPVIKVLESHVQNYQLDLEYEEGGDVNVWYNLTDMYDTDVQKYYSGASTRSNYFSARDQDSRNNFYIYNKGNITYTGSGHGATNGVMTDDEVKLFVNTMIAAYRQPESEPTISLDNTDGTDSNGKELIYLDYDGYNYSHADGSVNPNSTKTSLDSRVEMVNGEEMVAIYFSISDMSSGKNIGKQCYLTIAQDGTTLNGSGLSSNKIIIKRVTTDENGDQVLKDVTLDGNKYKVSASVNGTSYVMYFPYSKIRDGMDGVEYTFSTNATYTKKSQQVTTATTSKTVDVMLLPLFDLE
jgi:hypothetical protein